MSSTPQEISGDIFDQVAPPQPQPSAQTAASPDIFDQVVSTPKPRPQSVVTPQPSPTPVQPVVKPAPVQVTKPANPTFWERLGFPSGTGEATSSLQPPPISPSEQNKPISATPVRGDEAGGSAVEDIFDAPANVYNEFAARQGAAIAARNPSMRQMTPEEAQANEVDPNPAAHADVGGIIRERMVKAGSEIGANALESGVRQPVTGPLAGQTLPIGDTERGVVRGAGAFTGSLLADPSTYMLMGLGPESRFGRSLMGAGFGVQMGQGAVESSEELGQVWDREDIPREQKIEMGTQAILGAVMASVSAKHGIQETHAIIQDYLNHIPEADRQAVQGKIDERISAAAKEEAPPSSQAKGDIFDQVAPEQKPAEKPERFRLPRGTSAQEVQGPVKGPNIRTVQVGDKTYAFDQRKINADGVTSAVERNELWRLTGGKAPEAAKVQAEADVRGEEAPATEAKPVEQQTAPEVKWDDEGAKPEPQKIEETQAPTPKPDQASLGNEAPVVPQESQATQPERRTDLATRKRVADLTPDERAHELLTSPKTGLPNDRAFEEDAHALAESHPHVGYADLDDFKRYNDALGHEGVDKAVLPAVGDLFRDAAAKEPGGSVKVYHRSGDEFNFRSTTPEAIKRVTERVNKELAETTFKYETKDGRILEKKGTGLSHGIGTDHESAEENSHADKQRRKELGLREGGRDVSAVDTRGSSGEQTAVRENTERERVPGKPAEEVKPATPQPGSPEYESLRQKLSAAAQTKPSSHQSKLGPGMQRVVERLRTVADGLDKQIEDKQRPMTQNATTKRMREYRSRLHDGENMKRVQQAMRALGDAHEQGNVPKGLENLRTKDEIYRLVYKGVEGGGGYYDVIPSQNYANKTPQGKALQELMERHKNEPSEAKAEREKASNISQLEADVQFQKLPGYFPTPKPVVEKMLDAADIQPGDKVLEPSAGKGNIADLIKEREPEAKLSTIEPQSKLRQILELKGHELADSDFLGHQGEYDKIVMNPPFENGQDIDHVQHAFEMLKPGGKLVAIMSESPFFRSDRKGQAFREWLEEHGGTSAKLEPGSFKESGTGVNARMVEIEKPKAKAAAAAAAPEPSTEQAPQPTEKKYSIDNPFAARAESALKTYKQFSGMSAHDKAMAEHFPTGAGFGYGSMRSREKKLDATINRASKAVDAKRNYDYLKAQADAYERGEINAQGRSVDAGTRARAEAREAGRENGKTKIAAEGFSTRKINDDLTMSGSSRLDDGRTVSFEMDLNRPDGGYRYKIETPGGEVQYSNFYSSISKMRDSGELRKMLMAPAREPIPTAKQEPAIAQFDEAVRHTGAEVKEGKPSEAFAEKIKDATHLEPANDAELKEKFTGAAYQREYFKAALGEAKAAWAGTMNAKGDGVEMFEWRASNGGTNYDEKTSPEGYKTPQLYVKVPDDGHFLVNNTPFAIEKALKGATRGFSAPRASFNPEAKVKKFSAPKATPEAVEKYRKELAEELRIAEGDKSYAESRLEDDKESRAKSRELTDELNADLKKLRASDDPKKGDKERELRDAYNKNTQRLPRQMNDEEIEEAHDTIAQRESDIPVLRQNVKDFDEQFPANTAGLVGSPEDRPATPSRSIKQSSSALSAKDLEQFFTPGKIVTGYAGLRDKVVAFHPGDPSKPYPANHWSVDVVAVDAQGEPLAGERTRHHATMPDRKEIAQFRREQATKEPDGRSSERGSATASAMPIPALISSAAGIIKKGSNLYHGAVDKALDWAHMGQTRPEIRKFDPDAADLATKMDAGGQYHKAVAEMIGKKVTGPLAETFDKTDNYASRQKKNEVSRDRMKGFHFLADAQNREWLEENHPEDFHRWSTDPKIKEALDAYKPFEGQLRDAVKQLGGKTIDEDYIKRIMDFATSGVAYEKGLAQGVEGPMELRQGAAAGARGGGRDNVVSPQIDRSKARKDAGKYYWDHGVFDFGPSFEKRWAEVQSKLDEHRLAVHSMSMGTRIMPDEAMPDKVFYNGQEFYRPDIAKEIRDVQKRGVSAESKDLANALGVSELPTPKDVREYASYEPLRRGSRFETAARNLAANVLAGKEGLEAQAANVNRMAKLRYALPKEIVDALNDAGREKELGALPKMVSRVLGPLTQFIRQQIVGLGYGVPHMANILRKVVQAQPGGALNPLAWVNGFKVAFSKELKARGISGTEDPTYDMLLRNAAVSEGAIPEYKRYIEGNMDAENWAQTLGNAFRKGGKEGAKVTPLSAAAGVGRLAIEPLNRFSEAGHRNLFKPGGIDQRARLWLGDFLKDRYPDMDDQRIAHEVNQTLGRYNRASWTDLQRNLGPLMLFPGWDYSSMAFALKHPFKTAVAPAVLMLLANAAVHSIGANKNDEKNDLERVHVGKYSIRTNLFNDNMGTHMWGWALRGAKAGLDHKNAKQATGEVVKGIPGDVAGLTTGTMNPIISTPIQVGANRVSPGRQEEIAKPGDFKKKGHILPNKAAEDYADFGARRAFPIYDRATQAGQRPSLASFAGLAGVNVSEKKKKK